MSSQFAPRSWLRVQLSVLKGISCLCRSICPLLCKEEGLFDPQEGVPGSNASTQDEVFLGSPMFRKCFAPAPQPTIDVQELQEEIQHLRKQERKYMPVPLPKGWAISMDDRAAVVTCIFKVCPPSPLPCLHHMLNVLSHSPPATCTAIFMQSSNRQSKKECMRKFSSAVRKTQGLSRGKVACHLNQDESLRPSQIVDACQMSFQTRLLSVNIFDRYITSLENSVSCLGPKP